MRINQATLNKIEQILEDASYVVRYERGTFQSGYCVLEQRKVVVLNKFLDVEGRINTLVELIPQLSITYELLTRDAQKTYDEVVLRREAMATENGEPK